MLSRPWITHISSSVRASPLKSVVLDVCRGVHVAEAVPLHVGVFAGQVQLDERRPHSNGATDADAVLVHFEEARVALATVEDL